MTDTQALIAELEARIERAQQFDGSIATVRVDTLQQVIASLSLPKGGGEGRLQEPKYAFHNGRVFNRASGEAIPLDEPVFVFRARDVHALAVLGRYASFVANDAHRATIISRVNDFRRFASEHPLRMKEPDTEPFPLVEGGERSEKVCGDCGGHNPVWFAPSPLWNLVMGGPQATGDPGGIVCPVCFIRRAEASGIEPTAWEVREEPSPSPGSAPEGI